MEDKIRMEKGFGERLWVSCPKFLQAEDCEKLMNSLDQTEFEWVRQERFGHYGHVFKSDDERLPSAEESYCAEFQIAVEGKELQEIKEICFKNIFPVLKKYDPLLRYSLIPNVYKISKGSYFRSHTDDYAGEVGFTLFLGRRWCWDFGGILTFVINGTPEMIFPEGNTLLIRNEKERPHHFVTQVPNYVDDHYYLIVGWASRNDLGASKLRGEYFEI